MAACIIAIRYNQIGKKKIKTILNIGLTYWQKMSGLEQTRTGTPLRNGQLTFATQWITEIYFMVAYLFICLLMFTWVQKWYMYQLCNHPSTRTYDFQLRLPEGSSFLIHIKISIANFTPDLEHMENSWLISCSYMDRLRYRGVWKAPGRACMREIVAVRYSFHLPAWLLAWHSG